MSSIFLTQLDPEFDTYPKRTWKFSPAVQYPEYPWVEDELAREHNLVYESIRECFRLAGYDKEHYGLPEWNPLGEIIHKGDIVLLKPNWVEHKNKNEAVDDNLACLVTHPSVVRAILDYVVIALQGTGRIIVGDAPMQGCDLDLMFEIAGYNELFAFYKEQDTVIDIQDFRKYHRTNKASGVLSSPIMTLNSTGSVHVDLGRDSMHGEKDKLQPAYKVTDYTQEMTAAYHSEGKHIYEVNKTSILADVIINIPKPKTHRLAGMTAAVKNFVGITYEKACLPHRIEGDPQHGGDAYLKKSFWKERMHDFDEKRTQCSIVGNYRAGKVNDLLMKACYAIGTVTSGDKYRIGSWYGNDTIWRTSVDLNNILLHCDKQGVMQKTQQRTILTIGDMFVCGQQDGPVSPIPKKLGMVMMSDNPLLFDYVMCEIMQFAHDKLPIFGNELTYEKFGYISRDDLEKETLHQKTGKTEAIIQVKDFVGEKEWGFEPHTCWKGHVEKK
jgi:uncharacterized protein (DUF362 family)